jgi:hypothetical protein
MSLENEKTSSRIVYLLILLYPHFMKFAHLVIASVFVMWVFGGISSALAQEGGQPGGQAISVGAGPMLPKNIPATDEIMKGFNLAYDYPLSTGTSVEAGLLMANSGGAHFQDLAGSYRIDFPVQDFIIYGLGGADLIRMKKEGESFNYYGGFHMGAGMLASIAGPAYLRMEMRFLLHPGTILLFAFGVELHF